MIVRFTRKLPAPLDASAPTLALNCRDRRRTRYTFTLDDGRAAALLLPRGEGLRDGDQLCAEDGTLLTIRAAAEEVLRITAPDAPGLIRLTYHLANRHVSAMLTAEAIYIEPDPVLPQLIARLGGRAETVLLPFEPEPGAYLGGHHHHPGGLDDEDRSFGHMGEFLSRRAHGHG